MKLTQENIKETLKDINLGKEFMTKTPKANATKTKTNKWDLIKLKCSVQQKTQSTKCRDSPQNGRKYLQTMHLTKD